MSLKTPGAMEGVLHSWVSAAAWGLPGQPMCVPCVSHVPPPWGLSRRCATSPLPHPNHTSPEMVAAYPKGVPALPPPPKRGKNRRQ